LTIDTGAPNLGAMKPLGPNAERVRRLAEADPDITVSEIAKAVGLTTQRVYQILEALRSRGELDFGEET
jgi:predicted ArsR family transcriptional regulator